MQSSYISSGTNQMKHTDSIREETTTSAIFLEIGRNAWVARIRHLPKAMEKHCQNCRQLCKLHDGQTLECLKVQNSCQQTKSQAIQTKLLCCCHNLSQQCCSPNKSIEHRAMEAEGGSRTILPMAPAIQTHDLHPDWQKQKILAMLVWHLLGWVKHMIKSNVVIFNACFHSSNIPQQTSVSVTKSRIVAATYCCRVFPPECKEVKKENSLGNTSIIANMFSWNAEFTKTSKSNMYPEITLKHSEPKWKRHTSLVTNSTVDCQPQDWWQVFCTWSLVAFQPLSKHWTEIMLSIFTEDICCMFIF